MEGSSSSVATTGSWTSSDCRTCRRRWLASLDPAAHMAVDLAWEAAAEREKKNRTLFAHHQTQRVLPRRARRRHRRGPCKAVGDSDDVQRFVTTTLLAVGAPTSAGPAAHHLARGSPAAGPRRRRPARGAACAVFKGRADEGAELSRPNPPGGRWSLPPSSWRAPSIQRSPVPGRRCGGADPDPRCRHAHGAAPPPSALPPAGKRPRRASAPDASSPRTSPWQRSPAPPPPPPGSTRRPPRAPRRPPHRERRPGGRARPPAQPARRHREPGAAPLAELAKRRANALLESHRRVRRGRARRRPDTFGRGLAAHRSARRLHLSPVRLPA